MAGDPRVSVIIPNLNSPLIDQTLSGLRAQRFDLSQVEVLVVGLDQPGLVETDALVRFISTGNPAVPAVARNLGIRAARGELLCFLDADCIPDAGWLAALTAACDSGGAHVAGGGVAFATGDYWTLADNVSWFHDFVPPAAGATRDLLPSLNLCVRRQVVDKVGLFHEGYPRAAGEDAEWTTRMRQAGYRLHFVPDAIVIHRPARTRPGDLWRHAYTYGRYSVKVQPRYAGFLRTPYYLRRWWLVLLLSPLLALAAAARVYRSPVMRRRFWHVAPAVVASKVAWCWGAAHTLRWRRYPV